MLRVGSSLTCSLTSWLYVRSCQHQGVYLAAKEGDPDAQLQMKKLLGDKLFPGKATPPPTITVTPPPAAGMADPHPYLRLLGGPQRHVLWGSGVAGDVDLLRPRIV